MKREWEWSGLAPCHRLGLSNALRVTVVIISASLILTVQFYQRFIACRIGIWCHCSVVISGNGLLGFFLNAVSIMKIFPVVENFNPRFDLQTTSRLGCFLQFKMLNTVKQKSCYNCVFGCSWWQILNLTCFVQVQCLVTTSQCYWNRLDTAFAHYQIASR